MLSRMLHMHPEVLSLSEFWAIFNLEDRLAVEGTSGHVTGEMDREASGSEFWNQISEPDFRADGMLLAGLQIVENLYEHGRFDPATGVPPVCRLLAALTDDPDALYDELASEVPAWPRRQMIEHCRAFMAYLATALGRPVIVERSGGTLRLISALRQLFPEARFVFLHRNGPDTVLSMWRHPVFRWAAIRMVEYTVHRPSKKWTFPEEMMRAKSPEDFKGLTSPPFDKQRFLEYPIPLTFFAWLWSTDTRTGTRDIRELPHDMWMTMRYEHLIKNTREELTRLANFIGVPAERQWLDAACSFVKPGRVEAAVAELHPGELAAVRAACAAGTRAFDLLESEHAASAKLNP
jgi:hypothetical protein